MDNILNSKAGQKKIILMIRQHQSLKVKENSVWITEKMVLD